MSSVLERYDSVRKVLANTPTQLLVVSKTQPASALLPLIQAGQRAFGENYVQEALSKIAALAEFPLEWHFLGDYKAIKPRPSPSGLLGSIACRNSVPRKDFTANDPSLYPR